jgi:hypothetical protein
MSRTPAEIRSLKKIITRQLQTIEHMQGTIDSVLAVLEPAVGALKQLDRRAQSEVADILKSAARATRSYRPKGE